ncbi:hypothetical protein Q7C36_020850 [Tachysurus vachellii]|uniref:Uncharacterized protein n=1 Tax=Tachysurus vachellii TaxID=175792 RepID=A0AA88IY94_TACVA|nr:hypothetical protein Q7C36_020850 [Tachysurus vachellii]
MFMGVTAVPPDFIQHPLGDSAAEIDRSLRGTQEVAVECVPKPLMPLNNPKLLLEHFAIRDIQMRTMGTQGGVILAGSPCTPH